MFFFRQIGFRLLDLVGIGSTFQGVEIFRRRAITIILSFFILLITITQFTLKLTDPQISVHDIKSAIIVVALIAVIMIVQRLTRFFWVWLPLNIAFFINLMVLGVDAGTGIHTGAVMLALFMPIMGTYFIGRTGVIGGWLMGVMTVTYLYTISATASQNTEAATQALDFYLMAMGGLTLSLFMALTLHQALVQALNEAEKNLHRARLSEMERTRFFGTVSHEVRNSLNGIFGITTSLLREDLSDDVRRKIELVQSSGDSLVQVLNDMLELTRLESNGIEISNKPTELRAITLRAASRWQLGAADNNIEIRIKNDPDLPEWVLIDYTRITQVLDNLISNALRFTSSGHIELSMINAGTDSDMVNLELRVKDTGVGISAARTERIFEPYQQESSSTFSKHGGTGLGLYICRLLLGQMGGEIRVEDTSPRGTTFLVTLPVQISAPPEENGQPVVDAETFKSATHIIAVDDRLPNRVYVETLFTSWGMNITTAASGADCLKQMKSQHFDLLLLDLNMPEMSGEELLSRIRKSSSENRNIRTIIVSAEIPDETEAALRAKGVRLFLKKPITPKMLWEAINQAPLVYADTSGEEGI